MMMTRLLLACSLFLSAPALPGEESAPPPNHVVRTALQWMQSPDSAKRQAAFRSVHFLGKEALPAFEGALRKARSHHEKRLDDILTGRGGKKNAIREAAVSYLELKEERERVYKLIRTDYKKDPGKIRMLNEEMEKLTRTFDRIARLTDEDTSDLEKAVDEVAHALADLEHELLRFENPQDTPEPLPLAEQKEAALMETFEGEAYFKNRKLFRELQDEVKRLAKVRAYNKNLPWPRAHHTEFASHLNHQRVVIGLAPLELEEKLSAAAEGHCADMKNLGFFAHSSPIEEKRTPGMRARKAGYKGGFRGENIAMGYSNPRAAYQGWFGSDGHRFIMFARGPEDLGLGRVGNHWTLMTGR